ncbi:MAG: ARC6/PARC6 family protein [Synechococcaceae cyanobacterium]|nr:ARC6/PARC6 family protein [Synechococcaceae cyanobacterium]
MDLPIDHFRLLGVGPASDAQAVLRTLQQRLDRLPEEGFTADTLQARAELLRSSADLLSDGPRRAAYEADLTALAGAGAHVVPALEIPSSKEVGGLLLLFEADQPLEAFEIACRCLQPPQAPALGSSREADLTLLAGLACLGACTEFEQQRRYERAAQILQQGQQLLQRMGQRPDLRERMTRELERLAPYRVLDLLNRDLASSAERGEGLVLLEQLVERRGGLEGDNDPSFPPEEFRTFFKQIRALLTVQEQVDLFSRWGDAGSATADFLASTALTASGFAQRKPERIAAARERLLSSQRTGIEPLLANLSLLLGEVDTARASFEAGASRELRAWAERQSGDPLAQLCAYCRDWLSRDVLPGYRDLEADADLDAYFSDRDVMAYVEREDRISGRSYAPATAAETAMQGAAAGSPPPEGANPGDGGPSASPSFAWNFPPLDFGDAPLSPTGQSRRDGEREASGAGGRLSGALIRLPQAPPAAWLGAGGAALVALALAGAWLLRPRPMPPTPSSGAAGIAPVRPPQSAESPPATPTPLRPTPVTPPPAASATAGIVPLRDPQPDQGQVRSLLESWLTAKAAVLGGAPMPAGIDAIARPEQVDRLASERSADAVRGERQTLNVRIRSLRLEQTSPGRISATAELLYSDQRRAGDGRVLESTPSQMIRNRYVFGRDDGRWRFVAQAPAP